MAMEISRPLRGLAIKLSDFDPTDKSMGYFQSSAYADSALFLAPTALN
jgi:hypothetical protein